MIVLFNRVSLSEEEQRENQEKLAMSMQAAERAETLGIETEEGTIKLPKNKQDYISSVSVDILEVKKFWDNKVYFNSDVIDCVNIQDVNGEIFHILCTLKEFTTIYQYVHTHRVLDYKRVLNYAKDYQKDLISEQERLLH